MKTLIICNKYSRALQIAEEFNLSNEDFGHLSANITPHDVINSHKMQGQMFGRAIYDDKRPSDEVIAYISIFLKDGAFLVNYKNYKLKRTLENL